MTNKPYAIGLDIGTSSTGYAMTDMDGHLLKCHKRSTFGAVLFDEASPAADRRAYRSARRRLDRREQRIDLLQMLLQEEVCKQDADFFLRLNESFLQEDERRYPLLYGTLPLSIWADGSPFILPDGKPCVDPKGQPRTYPTIYHLRSALANNDKQADIRYVYLALHHIIKYRGHFLLENEKLEDDENNIQEEISEALKGLTTEPLSYSLKTDDTVISGIEEALKNKKISRSKRADTILALLEPDKNAKAAAKAFALLLTGNVGSLNALCSYDGDQPKEKLSLGSEDFDPDAYMEALGIHAILFEHILAIYRWQVFVGLCESKETISQTMIRRYEKHQQDLKQWKAWVRAFAPAQYNAMFRWVDAKSKNYCAYSGHYSQKKLPRGMAVKHCSQDDFYKSVRSLLNSVKTPEAVKAALPFLEAMENDNGFLPLLRINDNGAIPNQLHAQELERILDHQGKYYPSLLKNKEKIVSLCTFRLPYFVGPLNTASPFAKWIKREEHGHAYPWNFYDVVHKMDTAEGFINNLTNQCTYLPGEDVLPLHSLLYEEYLLLDELNRVTINGALISACLKKRIVDELFKRRKNVTQKAFVKWLQENTPYGNEKDIVIEHLHAEEAFAAGLRSYHDFYSHGFEINHETMPMIETLIRWSTIFENRGILREKIHAAYPDLETSQVGYVCKRRYTGWGRLSQELLDGIQGELHHDPATIIEVMRETNDNFMKVINHQKYGFKKIIDDRWAGKKGGSISLEEVAGLQGSPALKRGIWQATRIVEELMSVQGYAPAAIYIENTREDDKRKKGKRTTDRIAQLEQLYQRVGNPSDCPCDKLAQRKKQDERLSDREFLYFLQEGKCLYSGAPLDFMHLETYQVDHILPQSYVKDDSIDNRALVLASKNQRKKADLLLSDDIRHNMKSWWQRLKDCGLMSEKKFHNLTRACVSESEQLGFINRQLIETSQIVKHVTMLFKTHDPDIQVVGINARLSSSLRDAYGLVKIRELNDTHHAFDAFLACTLGTFMDKYLSWLSDESVNTSRVRECWKAVNHVNDTNGIVLGYFGHDQIDRETGAVTRNASSHIAYLKSVWGYKDHFISIRKGANHGKFFDETRYPAGSKEAKIPLRKGLPVARYGGFNSVKPSYIAAVAYQDRGQLKGELVNVPIMLVDAYEQDQSVLIDYLLKTDPAYKKYKDIRILRKKILLNQKILYDGSELILRSANEAWNAKQLYLGREDCLLVDQLVHRPAEQRTCTTEELDRLYSTLLEKMAKHYPMYAATIGERLNKAKKRSDSLSAADKATLILETLKIMQVNGLFAMYNAKLPELELSDNQGRICNKSFHPAQIILIDQSITGLHERRRPLWDSVALSSEVRAD